MTDNLKLWNAYADIDPKFTKAITGKSYRGTSPNPQYVIRCLTEMFGPVGQGFGWRVITEEFAPLGPEVLHWCRIEFWHTDRSHVFESYGQTKAVYTSAQGKVIVDEDAPKKSLTDAIIKAASHLGIAANIFLGRWDDQKYVQEVNAEFRQEERTQEAPPPAQPKTPPTPAQIADKMIRRFGEMATVADLDAFTDPDQPAGKAWATLGETSAPDAARVRAAYDKRKAELEKA